MSGRQMSQTAKYQGAKCLEREMSLPPIVWGTYCPGSQISGRQMSQRQLSGADRRAPNVRQPKIQILLEKWSSVNFINPLSLSNNWMVARFQDLGTSGVRSKVWVLTLGVLEVNPEVESVWDGLWRPGGAFFQIGLGCVMSHHHIEGLCTFLF